MNNPVLCDVSKLIGRVLISLIFILSGWAKIGGYAGTQAYMESAGVPGILLPLVILVELGGGLAILCGFFTRWVSLLLAAFCLLSAALFHYVPDDQMQMIAFMKNLAIAGGFLILACSGAGGYSLDQLFSRDK
ncbi:DoxX family protein [Microbulbifer sp. 2201CG32-9]|uniref:DoxX family protein n=1 Tax=unclassified Microbulbifer TaxID=2619833 RepID=UPI00345C140E